MTTTVWPTNSESASAAGAVAGLAIAATAELVSQSRGVDIVVLAGYVAAGLMFALTARPTPDVLVPARPPALRLGLVRTLVTVAAVVVAVLLAFRAHDLVYWSLFEGTASVAGPVLWAASLVTLLVTALFVRPLPTWPALWRSEAWPSTRQARRLVLALIAGFLVLGAGARLIALGSVPVGINADEGDRAASAISLLTGDVPRNLFASGWYYISNVYFSLLALVMKAFGVGVVQARLLGAVSGWLTLCVVVWIGFRHFGHRVALLTAILGAALAVMLQFSRETTEATPTALCWALSVAFFLEAARTGGTWPWVAAGIAGGLSLYLYPSGRLWLVLAALVCLYLVLRAGRARRLVTIVGAGATALTVLVTLGPFMANYRLHPGEFMLRARQVSIFSDDNASRLPYYDPDWNTAQLLWAQVTHSVALFANIPDGGGFWPSGRPILGGVLTVLVAVGLGWFTLSWRNIPRFTVALWFWVGVAGMVVTVETPNLHRMATAVPVLPLVAAAVLDATATRVGRLANANVAARDSDGVVLGGLAVILALGLAAQQAWFYFVTYADMDNWVWPSVQGEAVADQGPNGVALALARGAPQLNAGWIRLLAPHVDRVGVTSPGTQLPLSLAEPRDLGFVMFREQSAYEPFLRAVYPGGSVHRYSNPHEGLIVSVYRVPRRDVAARTGVLAIPRPGSPARVSTIGALPAGSQPGAQLRWSGLLHVPQYWNYDFRVGPGPARLRIDGKTVLSVPAGRARALASVALARGQHLLTVDGIARRAGGPKAEWRIRGDVAGVPTRLGTWSALSGLDFTPAVEPVGLLGSIRGDVAPQKRLDATLATCCLTGDVGADGRTYVAEWTGTLKAPRTGVYDMALLTEGLASLRIDGRVVVRTKDAEETATSARVRLGAGRHPVVVRYRVDRRGGWLEWHWTPPGGQESIVPPSALEPPPGAGVTSALPVAALGTQPADQPLLARR